MPSVPGTQAPIGVPGRLELQEIADGVKALGRSGEPVGLRLGREQARALHALGGAELDRLALVGIGHGGDGPEVGVRREGGHHFLAEAGEEIDHAARQVARRQHLAEDDGRIGLLFRIQSDRRVAARDHLRHQRDQAEERRRVRRHHADDAHRLGHCEIKVGRRHGIYVAQDLLVLVGPAGIVDQPVDREGDLPQRGRAGRPAHRESLRHLGAARLEHLREAVEDLGAVVRRAFRPAGARLCRSLDGVAQVLAGALGNVGEEGARRVLEGERPGALGADEGAADVDFRGLGDGEAAHDNLA